MIALQTREPLPAEDALSIVQDFVYDQLGNMIGIGQPIRMISGLQSAWSVPLVLTSPGYGIVGIVGAVMIDMEFGHIIGWTPFDEVRNNVELFSDEKEEELDTAFQNYRSQFSATLQ